MSLVVAASFVQLEFATLVATPVTALVALRVVPRKRQKLSGYHPRRASYKTRNGNGNAGNETKRNGFDYTLDYIARYNAHSATG